MIGYFAAIILFNTVAFFANKRLAPCQVVQIWTFTIAFQLIFDTFVDYKYHGYWYFSKGIDWVNLPGMIFLIPPVNILFLNWFPLQKSLMKKVLYIFGWEVLLLMYESFSLLPAPWGYFHYGWWKLHYSVVMNPVLLLILLAFFKWITHLENKKAAPVSGAG